MSVNTSNIGRRVDGTFEQYTPPRVVTVTGGPPVVDTTPVPIATGAFVPPGLWLMTAGNWVQVLADPAVPGQGASQFPVGTTFISSGSNAQAGTGVVVVRVRGG